MKKSPLFGRLLACAATLLAVSSFPAVAQQEFHNPRAKAAMREATPERQRQHLVDIGARLILPDKSGQIEYAAERALVYVQFDAALTANEHARLVQLGVRMLAVYPPSTYLVRAPRAAMETLQAAGNVRGWEVVLPEDRMDPQLYRSAIPAHVVNPDGSLAAYVRFLDDVSRDAAMGILRLHGIHVPSADSYAVRRTLAVSGSLSSLRALTRSPFVHRVFYAPLPPGEDNVQAAQISNIDDVQGAPYNLDGAGVILGIWDGGDVRANHPDLTGRVTLVETNSLNDHSTHVAGTMIGDGTNNAAARGMAAAATLFSWRNDGTVPLEHDDGFLMFGVRVTNNSWSPNVGWEFSGGSWVQTGNQSEFGNYDGQALLFDQGVDFYPELTICKSSGNQSTECNPAPPFDCDGTTGSDGQQYDNISNWGIAKNIVTVGNIQDNGTTINASSSCGPANDGRIKPDVVANGTTLLSTWAQGVTLPNSCGMGTDYCSISGTSMSTPVVAGLAALIRQRYEQVTATPASADIVKALLCNTATDLGRPGPDYIYGFGRVDGLAAIQTIDAAAVRILTDAVATGETDEFLIPVPAGTPFLRVTCNWTDWEGVADSGDPDIVNNLDLELRSPTNQVFFPWRGPGLGDPAGAATNTAANPIDTVEQVLVNAPMQGFWRARVRGTAVPAVASQEYALVSNVSFWLGTQPNITVSAALQYDQMCQGEFQDKVVSVFNTGGAPLLVHSVTSSAQGVFAVQPDPIQPVYIHPGAHVDFIVRFDPPSAGNFAGTLTIFSNDPDQANYLLNMTGSGCPPPDIAVTGSLDFGNVCPGELSEKTINVCNLGVDDLRVTSASFAACVDFEIVNNPFLPPVIGGYAIPAGHCIPVTLRYTPTGAGLHSCVLRINSNDPDEPVVELTAHGFTPSATLDVQTLDSFPATVVRSIAYCVEKQPLLITNTSQCPVEIKAVTLVGMAPDPTAFEIKGLPALPLWLLPGQSLGGNGLEVWFRPTAVAYGITADLHVTYTDDAPAIGDQATITQTLCGDGVRTGARLLIQRPDGSDLPLAERITLWKVLATTPSLQLLTIESPTNVPVATNTTSCFQPFNFHREWGTQTHPLFLQPGDYLVEVRATINGQSRLQKIEFSVDLCDFLPDVVLQFTPF